jgi:Asp-tRNA(Asn)/Glu-tRNA(Gln) amidotransferase A subunit family amidase
LGIPVGPYLKRAGEIARRHFDRAAAALSEAGFACHTVEVMPDFEDIAARHQTILAAEAAQVHAAWFERYADRYHGRTANLIREGQAIPAEVLATARAGQAALRQELESTMDRAGIDVWIAPATVGPAPRGLDSTGDPIMNLPWTQAGLPALSLPCGLEPDGLPLGLQLVARWNDDERLMTWARMIETTLGVLPAPAVAALGGVEGG